jgi:hypothetical protein
MPAGLVEAMKAATAMPEGLVEAMKAATAMPEGLVEAMKAATAMPEGLAEAIKAASAASDVMRAAAIPAVLGDLLDRTAEIWHEIDPPNWPEGASWSEMRELIAATGWSLTHVPRSEVIVSLLEAEPAERESVLLAHSEDVIQDCRSALRDLAEGRADHLADALAQALDAFDAGLHIPAQTTAASVLADIVNRVLGLSFAAALRGLAEDPDEMPVPYFRFWLIASTVPLALSQFRHAAGDEIPASFNRHAVAHTVDPRQYTKLNALIGLMLVTGLVCEIGSDLPSVPAIAIPTAAPCSAAPS